MQYMIWIWLAAVALFLVVEAATAGLVSLWFAVGATGALLSAIGGLDLTGQLVTFAVVSAVALAVTRPLVHRYLRGRKVTPTNLDRAIGRTGQVTEDVDGSSGAVYVDGKTWSARSIDGGPIPAGTTVDILKIEGVKLFVEKSKVLEGTT